MSKSKLDQAIEHLEKAHAILGAPSDAPEGAAATMDPDRLAKLKIVGKIIWDMALKVIPGLLA